MARVRLLIASLAIAAPALVPLLAPQEPAEVAVTVMCQPERAPIGGGGPAPIQLPTASANYVVDARGCAVVAVSDVPLPRSQGWLPASSFVQPIQFTTGVATGTTSFQIGVLPPSAVIDQIVTNSTANAVIGNIAIATTSGRTDVVTASGGGLACGANCVVAVPDAQLAKRPGSPTVPTPLFATAGTNWNNANVTTSVLFSYY